MKTIEQFYDAIKKDPALAASLQKAVESGTLDSFLKEMQVDTTAEEMKAFERTQLERMQSGELSDDELEAVSGGVIEWGSCGHVENPKDVQYEFHIGDRVEVYYGSCFGLYYFSYRGTIINTKVVYVGNNRYGPMYEVQYDDGGSKGWVYQQELSY